MIVISDTSVFSNLLIIDQIEILPQLFGQVMVPQAVFLELQNFTAFDITSTLNATWLKVKEVGDAERIVKLREVLDAGESEAIILATELQADLLIIDEAKGRKIASAMGINLTGLLGVLLRAKAANLIIELKPQLDRLENEANFYISRSVRDRILALAGEH